MPRKRVYVDSSAIIIGIEQPSSNSALVLELIAGKQLEAFTSEKTLREVGYFFARHRTQRQAYFVQQLIRREFSVIPFNRIEKDLRKWRGKIKEKDLEHLAAVKALALPRIVAFDRDFKAFKEYRTPKKYLEELGLKARETEY